MALHNFDMILFNVCVCVCVGITLRDISFSDVNDVVLLASKTTVLILSLLGSILRK